ncbi:MAG: glutamate--tRNA ligase [Bacteroidia bacterium]|nr:glutamate--tRNA ligase [Bacteroidia bacterium]
MMNRNIRVRFAPSPTGPLHIGGIRTALYNYLFARKYEGSFILRIEDTDQARFVAGAEEYIFESLKWCNIKPDEGVEEGGPYGPYRQSDRRHIYNQYAEELVKHGFAYYAFDTAEELDKMRKYLEERHAANTSYNTSVRMKMKNSLTLSQNEVEQRISSGAPYVIRFKIPENEDIEVYDIIRGNIVFNTAVLDDKILYKSDGMPTYHLANVVDDYLMEISHVIRGEEWLSSLPLHVLLYRGFGWQERMPQFAHLPLILKPEGAGKLSKRDGDKLGFPVFPLEWKETETGEIFSGYRESGYLSEAVINLLAFLGWNPGAEQEIFSMEELIKSFSFDRVIKSGARFDPEKAKWFNHQYIMKMDNKRLSDLFMPYLTTKGIEAESIFVENVCGLVKERANFIMDIWKHSHFFFHAPEEYDKEVIKKRWKEDSPVQLQKIIELLQKTTPFEREVIERNIKDFISSNSLNFGQIMIALRLCLVGSSMGPELFDIMPLLGKDEVIRRIEVGINKISVLYEKGWV